MRAGPVINATGVWTTERPSGLPVSPTPCSRGPRRECTGSWRRDRIDSECALILAHGKSVLFVLPWGPPLDSSARPTPTWHYGLDHPAATHADIAYLLDHVNESLRVPLGFDDVIAVFVGLRPLLGGTAEETAKLSRNHGRAPQRSRVLSVAGGKYTTYRLMARDAVNLAVRDLRFVVDPSRTADVPLLGAVGLSGAELRLGSHPGQATWYPVSGPPRCPPRHAGRRGARPDRRPPRSAASRRAPRGTLAEISCGGLRGERTDGSDDVLTRRTHIALRRPTGATR